MIKFLIPTLTLNLTGYHVLIDSSRVAMLRDIGHKCRGLVRCVNMMLTVVLD